jgi:serine/threonine-protein kinase PknG
LLGIVFVNVANFMILPLLALHLQLKLHTPPEQIGIVLATQTITQQVLPVITGVLGDRWGPRRLLVVGIIVRSLGYAGFVFARDLPSLLACALLVGSGGAAFMPSAKAMIVQVESRLRLEALTLRSIAVNVGAIVGPLLGALLFAHFQAALLASALIYLGFLGLLARSVPRNSKTAGNTTPVVRSMTAMFLDGRLLGLTVCSAGFWFLYTQFIFTFPLYVEDRFRWGALFGVLFAINGAVILVLQYRLVTWLSRRLTSWGTLTVASFVLAGAYACLTLTGATVSLVAFTVLFSIGELLMAPTLDNLASEISSTKTLAGYLGFVSLGWALGAATGNLIGGALYAEARMSGSYSSFWAINVSVAAGSAVAFFLLGRLLGGSRNVRTGLSAPRSAPAQLPELASVESGACKSTPSCSGNVEEGYCNVCGRIASPLPPPPAAGNGSPSPIESTPSPTRVSAHVASPRRTSTHRTRTVSGSRVGAGLVSVPPMPNRDPASAVMVNPEVAELERFCPNCNAQVGRGRDGKPGRPEGFCSKCRTPYSFVPSLKSGDLVAAQYRIFGSLAYGGLGWIYLAQDERVSNRWVVLKGLLNSNDPDAMAAAVAERQFLARVEHPNVVKIHNFVEHAGAHYIVMEYIGGKTLKDILLECRQSGDSTADSLPVEHAIAYILGILPAFAYLHGLGLVYNDFKPDNVMLSGDDVRLIDLGAVTRIDDANAALYGTDGYQAPEVSSLGPSIVSDLYAVTRSLAVLILDSRGYQTKHRYRLPTPDEHSIFAHHESLYRFLLKGTALNPDDRFQSADEMAEQLLGVLREVVAAKERTPRPAVSTLFSADLQAVHAHTGTSPISPDWRHLPALKVNPTDAAASFVVNVPALGDPPQQLVLLSEAIRDGQVPDTIEVDLAVARVLIWTGRLDEARRRLDEVNRQDPWDWRVIWYRGISLLMEGKPAQAMRPFEQVSFDLPGELAPKLAEALGAELSGELERAAQLYDVVSATDSSFTSACFGLARVREYSGNRPGAVEAYRRIPETSSLYTAAQIALVRTLIRRGSGADPGLAELALASTTLKRLWLDDQPHLALAIELLETALSLLDSRAIQPNKELTVLDHPLERIDLSTGLEQAYRDLARLATGQQKIRFVDRANQVRPLTAV